LVIQRLCDIAIFDGLERWFAVKAKRLRMRPWRLWRRPDPAAIGRAEQGERGAVHQR
jgi:hypothetical protein